MQAGSVGYSISCSSRGILPMLVNASAPLNLQRHVFKRWVMRVHLCSREQAIAPRACRDDFAESLGGAKSGSFCLFGRHLQDTCLHQPTCAAMHEDSMAGLIQRSSRLCSTHSQGCTAMNEFRRLPEDGV